MNRIHRSLADVPDAVFPWRLRLLTCLIAAQLAAGVTAAVLLQPEPTPQPGAVAVVDRTTLVAQRSAELSVARQEPAPEQQRLVAVTALLERRGRAVLARDREGFLATVDPQAGPFRQRQAELFDALAEVPLTAWVYTLRDQDEQPGDPALDARYGTWWAPRVVLGHSLEGIDADPAEANQQLTFVRRAQGWFVAADDDFDGRGARTARALWDFGPVTVVRGEHTLVLGHPESQRSRERLAADVDAAVPRVTAAVGEGWPQRVAVLVPADQDELGRLVQTGGSLEPIAALAVSGPVRGGSGRAGDRVLVNPANLARLGPLGRRVVLTHEVTHIATRPLAGPLVPLWLSEGLADHVGYRDAGVPIRVAAGDLRREVRAGRLPTQLPLDTDFHGDNAALSQAYEQAWLAVELLVDRYGRDRVLQAYRALGARGLGNPAVAVDEVLRAELGISTAELTADWRASLSDRLG